MIYNPLPHHGEFSRSDKLLGVIYSQGIKAFYEKQITIFKRDEEYSLRKGMKDRRTKLQIYYDVISAILSDKQAHTQISKTRIQQKCNTSYDKLIKYLDEMHDKGLINNTEEIEITESGSIFFEDFSKINSLIDEITQRIS